MLTIKTSLVTERSIGLLPSLFLANNVGCLVSKYFKQSWCPYSAQKCAGVFPSTSFEFVSDPFYTNACTTPRFPLIHAMCNGVLKLLVLHSILAPY